MNLLSLGLNEYNIISYNVRKTIGTPHELEQERRYQSPKHFLSNSKQHIINPQRLNAHRITKYYT
jgi:hypothetical protein